MANSDGTNPRQSPATGLRQPNSRGVGVLVKGGPNTDAGGRIVARFNAKAWARLPDEVHKAKKKTYDRNRYLANRQGVIERNAAWDREHPESARERRARWRHKKARRIDAQTPASEGATA